MLMIWLFILGSGLIFLFLFLIYFSRIGQSDWIRIQVPNAFIFSTASIALSSGSLALAIRNLRIEKYQQGCNWLFVTLILALSFCGLQYAGWRQLYQSGIYIHQISGSFMYLLSGLHFSHILLGLLGLMWIFIDAFVNRKYVDGFIQSLNPAKSTRLQIVSIFWHFLGLLWFAVFGLLWLSQ